MEMSGLERSVNCESASELVNVREDRVREPEATEKREHVSKGVEGEVEEGKWNVSVVNVTLCPSMMNTASVLAIEETAFSTALYVPLIVRGDDAVVNVREVVSAV